MLAVSVSEFFARVKYCLERRVEMRMDVDAPIIDSLTLLYLAIMHGRLDVVKLLLANRTTVDPVADRSWTPLHFAAQQGSAAVVNMLIAKQASIDAVTSEGATPLFIAAQHGHTDVVTALLKSNATVDAALETGETPLAIACSRGHARIVSALLASGADTDPPNIYGETPLYAAAFQGHTAVVSVLLASKENVDGVILRGDNPLYTAAYNGNVRVVSTLLAAQVDANSAHEQGRTPLHVAAEQGHADVVSVLLANQANVNVADLDGSTPLHLAAQEGCLQVVHVLLDKKASVNVIDVHGATPLHASAQNGHVDIVTTLLNYQANMDAAGVSGMTALFVAAGQGHMDVVSALLAAQVTVDAADADGWTPLHMATQNDHVDVVLALLATGQADVNARTMHGATPLHIAANLDRANVVAVLLANQANVDAADTSGSTPLHIAALSGHLTVVELLLKSQANVSAVDNRGATPFFDAVSVGHVSVVALLLSQEAGVIEQQDDEAPTMSAKQTPMNVVNSYVRVLLNLAAQHGNAKLVKMLLASNVCVDALTEDHHNVSPLHIAAAMGHKDVAFVLLKHGANVNAAAVGGKTRNNSDIAGITPLHVAAQNGHTSMLTLLLANEANVEAVTENGETALHAAARRGNLGVLSALLKRHADADAANFDGATALHFAAKTGDTDAVRELLAYQANLDAVTVDGETPLHFAAQHGHIDALRCLLAAAQAKLNQAPALSDHARSCELVETEGVAVTAAGHGNSASLRPFQEKLAAIASEHAYRGIECLETTDKKENTPMLIAAKMGHFGVVNALVEAGARVNVRATDGETVLTAAARHRNLGAVSQLLDLGCLTPSSAANVQHSLLSATLQTLREYEDQTHEFKTLWLRVVNRLAGIYERLNESTSQEIIFQFARGVFHSVRLKSRCSQTGIFSRLVSSPSIATAFRDLHTELDFLEHRIDRKTLNLAVSRGSEAEYAADEVSLLEIFQEKTTGAAIFKEFRDERGMFILEDATLIEHFVRENGDKVSQELLDLLEVAVSTILEIVREKDSPPVPSWFIPSYDTELNWISRDAPVATECVSSGTWLSSAVNFSQHSMRHKQFIKIVDRCFPLQHPNVVKIFGAWHLHQPFAAIYESVLYTNLREYLAREENKSTRWQKLHEVSLGLKYLLEREVLVETLTCAHIWVGTDCIAKINALTACATPQEDSESEHLRWQAPEVVHGAAPSSASSIYSLAMCIYEALSGKVPWDTTSNWLLPSEILEGFRPKLPEGMTDAQRKLVERMWLMDPSKRPSIASVEQSLKLVADEEKKSREQIDGDELTAESAWIDVERTEISELGFTIKDYLEHLEDKCKLCRESQDAVQHIFQRLRDVYNHVRKKDNLPATSVVIVTLCDVMQSLHCFLGNAYRGESVLLRAKSQKATLQSHVFHRRLDELLDLLVPKVVDPIHTWEQQPIDPMGSDKAEDEAGGATKDSPGTHQAIAPAAGTNVVKIVRYKNERLNQRFKELDFAAIDAAVANSSMDRTLRPLWLVYLGDINYDKGKSVGSGSFGKVYKATWLGTPAVIKFMGYEVDQDAYSHELFFHELRVWFPLSHPNVVKLLGACHVGKSFFVCEFAGNGTLVQYLERNKNAADRSWQLLHQAALGLQYVHKFNILHNDLKCDNILIGSDGEAKLTDFGLSCILNSAEVAIAPGKQGAVQWKSPEYLRGDPLTLASDIYSFGMCIIQAMTVDLPWKRKADVGVRYLVENAVLPLQPECLSKSQWTLIEMMCAADPVQRVGISFVVDKLYDFAQQQQASTKQKESVCEPPDAP